MYQTTIPVATARLNIINKFLKVKSAMSIQRFILLNIIVCMSFIYILELSVSLAKTSSLNKSFDSVAMSVDDCYVSELKKISPLIQTSCKTNSEISFTEKFKNRKKTVEKVNQDLTSIKQSHFKILNELDRRM